MTQAVLTVRDGHAFQARMFWMKAAKLLNPNGAIVRVGFESGPRGFDDVWVEYDPNKAPPDQFGKPLLLERLQCKWHARNGSYTHKDLTMPEYIGATTVSLLARAYDANVQDRASGLNARVRLMTNHRLDASDALYALVKTSDHMLRLEELFEGKTVRSATGALRDLWQRHLGIDEAELRALCSVLALSSVSESLDDLRERMDETFLAFGIRQTEINASSNIYDDTVYKWLGQGRLEFDHKGFKELCEREGLLAATGGLKGSKVFGFKSFEHHFDRLEDRCDDVLSLVSSFDDRFLNPNKSWRTDLLPALRNFMKLAAQSGTRIRLAMDAHSTLAFAAGAVLDTKSGRIVDLEQRTPKGIVVWASDDAVPQADWARWQWTEHDLGTGGTELAVAVSLTRDTEADARTYIGGKPAIGKLLVALPTVGASQRSVACGAHADMLAEGLVAMVKCSRAVAGSSERPRIHVFMAAPNGFSFYVGRHVSALKPITLYEFDFQAERTSSYTPSLSLPEAEPEQRVPDLV